MILAQDALERIFTVLDPFLGSGTTAVVARRLGRHYIGIEPNSEYVTVAHARLKRVLEPLKQ